jgi:hypothetical protein
MSTQEVKNDRPNSPETSTAAFARRVKTGREGRGATVLSVGHAPGVVTGAGPPCGAVSDLTGAVLAVASLGLGVVAVGSAAVVVVGALGDAVGDAGVVALGALGDVVGSAGVVAMGALGDAVEDARVVALGALGEPVVGVTAKRTGSTVGAAAGPSEAATIHRGAAGRCGGRSPWPVA